ncbi:hypothetical protein BD560DRAFT_391153 [Blakeslea trispora]|nr:hypothetical protein BD560DRAFT_391153 [Blakeslea trispora]
MAAQQYEFHPPTNMNAIRCTIMQRVKQRNETRQTTPLTPPATKHDMDKKLPYLHLDNGLPSPPIETCSFEEEPEMEESLLGLHSPTATLPDSPPSPVLSVNPKSPTAMTELLSSSTLSPEEIREKIKLLKEEKHKLFQAMKDLLSQPKTNATTPASPPPTPSSPAPPITTTLPTKLVPNPSPLERSRSQSRDGSIVKTRPIIARSRSISHSDFNRPISRYSNSNGSYHHDRNRFYSNSDNRYAYNNRLSLSSASSSSQLASHAMPRRIMNNPNTNSNPSINSYPSSRYQLTIRPSLSSRPSTRPDRHSRY